LFFDLPPGGAGVSGPHSDAVVHVAVVHVINQGSRGLNARASSHRQIDRLEPNNQGSRGLNARASSHHQIDRLEPSRRGDLKLNAGRVFTAELRTRMPRVLKVWASVFQALNRAAAAKTLTANLLPRVTRLTDAILAKLPILLISNRKRREDRSLGTGYGRKIPVNATKATSKRRS
jgi:hypothetical protein